MNNDLSETYSNAVNRAITIQREIIMAKEHMNWAQETQQPRKQGKGIECLQNLCVSYMLLTDINCLSRPINHSPQWSSQYRTHQVLFITDKRKHTFVQRMLNIPVKVASRIWSAMGFVPVCSLFLLGRPAQSILVVYHSESRLN